MITSRVWGFLFCRACLLHCCILMIKIFKLSFLSIVWALNENVYFSFDVLRLLIFLIIHNLHYYTASNRWRWWWYWKKNQSWWWRWWWWWWRWWWLLWWFWGWWWRRRGRDFQEAACFARGYYIYNKIVPQLPLREEYILNWSFFLALFRYLIENF